MNYVITGYDISSTLCITTLNFKGCAGSFYYFNFTAMVHYFLFRFVIFHSFIYLFFFFHFCFPIYKGLVYFIVNCIKLVV